MNRRTLLKGSAVGAASMLGLPFVTGTGISWKGMTIDVECVSRTEIAKFEFEGGIRVEEDFGSDLVDQNGTSFTFEDEDGDEFTIDLEGTRHEDGGELREFAFESDADHVGSVVVKGGPEEETFYVDPNDTGTDGEGLHAPINPNPKKEQYYGVSNVQFYECTEVEVVVTDVDSSATPGELVDLAEDDIRFGITHGPFHHDDQHVFDNGVAPAAGNGTITADGNLRFTFPLADAFVDEPDSVRNSKRFVAELLVDQAEGGTWAGDTPFPVV